MEGQNMDYLLFKGYNAAHLVGYVGGRKSRSNQDKLSLWGLLIESQSLMYRKLAKLDS